MLRGLAVSIGLVVVSLVFGGIGLPPAAWAIPQDPGGPRVSTSTAASVDEAPPPAAPPPAPGPPSAPPTTPTDGADAQYHAAFVALADGDSERAMALLEDFLADHPQHPLAARARELLYLLDERAQFDTDDPFAPERRTGWARAELAVGQTALGILLGVEVCGAASCDDARPWVGALSIGGLAGLSLSLLGTQDGITPGNANLINSASLWGVWNGIAIAGFAEAESEGLFGAMLAGHLVGLGTGVATALLTERGPLAGDVSFATSLGLWSGVLTLFVHGLNDFDGDARIGFSTLLIASDLGLAAGIVLVATNTFRMSRARTLLIDASGVVGMLMGMGITVLAEGEVTTGMFATAMGGTLVGLGLGTYLTRNWDAPELPVSFSLMPVEGGATLGFSGRF